MARDPIGMQNISTTYQEAYETLDGNAQVRKIGRRVSLGGPGAGRCCDLRKVEARGSRGGLRARGPCLSPRRYTRHGAPVFVHAEGFPSVRGRLWH